MTLNMWNYNSDDDSTGNLSIRNAENTRNDTCVRACDFHEDQPKWSHPKWSSFADVKVIPKTMHCDL